MNMLIKFIFLPGVFQLAFLSSSIISGAEMIIM